MDDLQAVERVKRGDMRGLAWLVDRYQSRAVRAAYAITHDRAQAEDLVQTLFVQLATLLRTFDHRRPFAPWFFTSLVNAAVRSTKREQKVLSLNTVINPETGETFADLLPDLAALPLEAVEHHELSRLIHEALAKLTPEQRAVVVMRYYLDMPTHEISAELHCPNGTTRWRLHSALKRLRGLLALNEQ